MKLYIVKNWLIKAIPDLERQLSEESGTEYEFASFGDEFVPFVAKNQFKSHPRKYAPLPKSELLVSGIEEKIAMIMNPTQQVISKDSVRVQMQILPKQSKDFFYVPHMDEVAFFMYLNQEALRI